jgi:hypothetical protein
MSSSSHIRYLDVAPLLPASVALIYIAFVAFRWEQALARRIYGARTHDYNDTKSVLPTDAASFKPQESSTWFPQMISSALATKLWALHESERITLNICLVQIVLIMAESAITYLCYPDWKRGRLMSLGAAWTGMALRSQSLEAGSSLADTVSALCITVCGVASVLPEQSTIDQGSSLELVSEPDKSGKADHPVTTSAGLWVSLATLHIFSVAQLLVYLLHDYPTLSSWLLYGYPSLGPSVHFLIAFGLLLIRHGSEYWQATEQQQQTLLQHLKVWVFGIFTGTPGFVRCAFLPLSLLALWLFGFFLASYMTSCLGFSKLVLGQTRSTPQFSDGGVFGGFVYWMILGRQVFLRWDKFDMPGRTFYLVMAFVTAFGQTITGLTVLAFGVYTLQKLS